MQLASERATTIRSNTEAIYHTIGRDVRGIESLGIAVELGALHAVAVLRPRRAEPFVGPISPLGENDRTDYNFLMLKKSSPSISNDEGQGVLEARPRESITDDDVLDRDGTSPDPAASPPLDSVSADPTRLLAPTSPAALRIDLFPDAPQSGPITRAIGPAPAVDQQRSIKFPALHRGALLLLSEDHEAAIAHAVDTAVALAGPNGASALDMVFAKLIGVFEVKLLQHLAFRDERFTARDIDAARMADHSIVSTTTALCRLISERRAADLGKRRDLVWAVGMTDSVRARSRSK